MKYRRFIIRDIETKNIYFLNNKRMDFDNRNSALDYWRNMNFGLNRYYEIYDMEEEVILNETKR